jgi:hypothetical protein
VIWTLKVKATESPDATEIVAASTPRTNNVPDVEAVNNPASAIVLVPVATTVPTTLNVSEVVVVVVCVPVPSVRASPGSVSVVSVNATAVDPVPHAMWCGIPVAVPISLEVMTARPVFTTAVDAGIIYLSSLADGASHGAEEP